MSEIWMWFENKINADNTGKVKKAEEAVKCYSYQELLSNLSSLRAIHNVCVFPNK